MYRLRELSRYSDSLRAGLSGDRIPLWFEISRTRPDRSCGPPNQLKKGCQHTINWEKMRSAFCFQIPIVVSIGGPIISVVYRMCLWIMMLCKLKYVERRH
jgi:hypothetical protein